MEFMKYNHFIFIYTLFGNSPTGQTRTRIFTHESILAENRCHVIMATPAKK